MTASAQHRNSTTLTDTTARDPLVQFSEGEFAGSVDRDQHAKLTLLCEDFSDIDMEEADRLCLERFLGLLVPRSPEAD